MIVETIYSTLRLEKWFIILLLLLWCIIDSSTPKDYILVTMMTFLALPSILWKIMLLLDKWVCKKHDHWQINVKNTDFLTYRIQSRKRNVWHIFITIQILWTVVQLVRLIMGFQAIHLTLGGVVNKDWRIMNAKIQNAEIQNSIHKLHCVIFWLSCVVDNLYLPVLPSSLFLSGVNTSRIKRIPKLNFPVVNRYIVR